MTILKNIYLSNRLLYLLVGLLFCLTSCNFSQQRTPKYCNNEVILFSVADSTQKVSLNYNQPYPKLMKSIELALNRQSCWDSVNFGLVLHNQQIINSFAFNKCQDNTIRCGTSYAPEMLFSITSQTVVTQDFEPIPIDSIKYWIAQNYPKDPLDDIHIQEIAINWQPQVSKYRIEKVLKAVVEGYLMVYRKLSHKHYQKPLCDLNLSQVDVLKKILPFRIEIAWRVDYPLPVPPDELIEIPDDSLEHQTEEELELDSLLIK